MMIAVKNEPLYYQFRSFFKSITEKESIALLHDTDPDGTSSGKIIYHAVERLGGKISLLLINERKEHSISDEKINLLKGKEITKLITTDKVVDTDPVQIKKIESFAEICVFDHHIIQHDISSKRTTFLKAQLLFEKPEPVNYCSTKLSYDLLNSLVDLSDLDWICVIGIIGDMAYPAWPAFINNTLNKHDIKKKDNIFDTDLGQITQLISFAEAMSEAEQCFDLMLISNTPQQALKKLHKYFKIKKEFDYYVDNIEKLAVRDLDNNFLFLKIKSPYKIKSMVSSTISSKYPHQTIIVVQEIDNEMTISARRSDSKINMHELLKKSLTGLNGSGGGHLPAAGGCVSLMDFPKFKEKLKKELQQIKVTVSS